MNTELRTVKVGEIVKFFNAEKKEQDALVTAVWSPTCINLVIVSLDENKTDCYGRQIERQTSVGHISQHLSEDKSTFFGMCWQ